MLYTLPLSGGDFQHAAHASPLTRTYNRPLYEVTSQALQERSYPPDAKTLDVILAPLIDYH